MMHVLVWLYDDIVDRIEGPFDSAELAHKHDDDHPRMYALVDGSMRRWRAFVFEVNKPGSSFESEK